MKHWRVIAFALLLIVLSSLPYAAGWAAQTPDTRYSGFVVGATDGYSYLGKMRLGVAGDWRFHLFYTEEPHDGAALTFLPYIAPGHLLRLMGLADSPHLYEAMILTFHAMRLVFGLLAVWMIARFIAAYLPAGGGRWPALVLATMGGGLGWLMLPLGEAPPSWYIPEAFTWLVLMLLPHVALGRAAMFGGLLLLLRPERTRRDALLAAALWHVTALAVPFYLAVIYVILAVWGLLMWIRARAFPRADFLHVLIATVPTLPLFGYYYLTFATNPVFAQWSAQNILTTPPLWHMALAYAPYLPFALMGARAIWRDNDRFGLLLIAWALVGLLLIYAPLNVQRRLGEGVLIALAILTVRGLGAIASDGARRRWQMAIGIAALSGTALFTMGTALAVAGRPPELFVSADDRAVYDCVAALDVDTASDYGPLVLAPLTHSTRLPAFAHVRTIIGHGPETLHADAKEQAVAAFYAGTLSEGERAALLARADVVLFTEDSPCG